MIGHTLGHYRIEATLGEGGMGVVYRAFDTHLDRPVAIKVLRPDAVANPERTRRFVQEAKAASALNDPRILHIYDIDRAEGVDFIAMEYVPGKTLDQVIGRKGLALGEALRYAVQIADALAKAHAAGIVHRDIKPANIMVTGDGQVKLLDFGLAKLTEAIESDELAPTETVKPHTEEGTIVGTVAYMSPEQAEGKKVDARSDIFSFGSVLYEMVTGRRAFSGETKISTLSAILHKEPPPLEGAPPELEKIIARCLRKDPARRIQHMVDVRLALEDLKEESESGKLTAQALARPRRVVRPVVLVILVASVAVAVAVWVMYRAAASRPTEARWQKYTQLTDLAGEEGAPVISPDGALLAYTSRARGSSDIYVQRIGGRNPILVAGDPERQESAPAFSPDGQRLAFHVEDADGGIFIVGATGESSRRLTDAGFHPAWSPDGRSIVYCSEALAGPDRRMGVSTLWVVDVDAGQPRKIDDGDAVQPAWSPSGARIAFWAATGGQRDLFTIPAAGGARVAVLQDAAVDQSPAWAPDGRSLYFASNRGGTTNLWRIAVDESTGRPLGAPEPVTGGVQAAADLPSVSKDGNKLVFRSRLTIVNPVAVPFDSAAERLGTPTPLFEHTGILNPSDVSPDGQWLALWNFEAQRKDIFICRTDGRDLRRLTDDEAIDSWPVWSPDGRELAFYSNRGGDFQIWTVRPDGSRLTRRTEIEGGGLMFPVWSPKDDRMVACAPRSEAMIGFMWNLSAGWSSSKALPGLNMPEGWLRPLDWSADGRRLAGVVQDAGANAVGIGWYDVNAGISTLVSHDRAPSPSDVRWLPDSRRILYVNDKNELVIVDADTRRRKVLPTAWPFQIADGSVALAPDGRTMYVGARRVESDIWMVER